jgi:hypothetical protein
MAYHHSSGHNQQVSLAFVLVPDCAEDLFSEPGPLMTTRKADNIIAFVTMGVSSKVVVRL